MAASIRISKALGGGRREVLRAIGFGALGLSSVFMLSFALVFAGAGTALARGFSVDPAVISLAAQLLVVAAVFQLFDGGQVVSAGALRGLADVRVPTVITFIAYWVVALPGGYLLAFPDSARAARRVDGTGGRSQLRRPAARLALPPQDPAALNRPQAGSTQRLGQARDDVLHRFGADGEPQQIGRKAVGRQFGAAGL